MTRLALIAVAWLALELLVAAVAVSDPSGWGVPRVMLYAAPLCAIVAFGIIGRTTRPTEEETGVR